MGRPPILLRLPRIDIKNMFGQAEAYPYVEVNRQMEFDGDSSFRRYTFHFKSRKNHTYLVYIDEFQLMTQNGEAASLITTCIAIMWEFYKANPYRSFGFIGMNSEGEATNTTKRFKLYSKVMARKFNPKEFKHLVYPKKSAYLMLNVHAAETNPKLLESIETFFDKHYEDLI
jgi:hypothetical protein